MGLTTADEGLIDPITASRISDEQREGTLFRYFGHLALHVEQAVYTWMGRLCDSYKGGYWEFYDLSNGGFFMAPVRYASPVEVVCETNGYRGQMSVEAAAITACLFALSDLSFKLSGQAGETVCERFYQLRDFAGAHPEAGEIFAAID